ncbi:MAG: S1 RNA-binding domain-containing protein [Candidatus Omnitrophota bacterium]
MANDIKEGDVLDGIVSKIAEYGAFCDLTGCNKKGLVHISQISSDFVKNVSDHLKVGDKVRARVVRVTPDGKIDLSLKNVKPKEPPFNPSLEEKLSSLLAKDKK